MLHFRSLDVYRAAIAFVPKAYKIAECGDRELANQLRRAALSISLNIAEGTGRLDDDQRRFYKIARGSALECGAVIDAMRALELDVPDVEVAEDLLVRVVSMLTRMI